MKSYNVTIQMKVIELLRSIFLWYCLLCCMVVSTFESVEEVLLINANI